MPNCDVILGGFPCQDFSMLRGDEIKRKGVTTKRGVLYTKFVEAVYLKKPMFFVAENVKGLMSANKGKAIKQIVSDFSEAGYDVTYKVLNASFFGVPQKRERVFIIGTRRDKGLRFLFPEGTGEIVPLGVVAEEHRSIEEKYYFSKRALEGLKKANKAFNKGRAQDLNAPCNTVSTHLAKVSLNGTDPVLLVKAGCYRRLTPLEAARIQSFPNDFSFEGSDAKKYIQIGNAIPPVLMWHIASAVKEQIFNSRPIYKTKTQRDNVADTVKEYVFETGSILAPAKA